MSGKFRFISLTDSSLLIEDSSDTGIELSDAFGYSLSFLDVRITHEQLLRFFILSDNARAEEFFSRIVTYRRKFFDEVYEEDVIKLAVSLATEFEELFADDQNFAYEHLMRRLPQDNVLYKESVLTPRTKTENELLFTAERVSKRLPDLLARHATQDEKSDLDFIVEIFDERVDLLHLQGRLPKEIVELNEAFDAYRFQNARERVFTEDVVTRARGLVAKHETQLADPFGDGSVPQKPGFDHIVEFLDERIDTLLIRPPIQIGMGALEQIFVARKVDPNDRVFTAVQEALNFHKVVNGDPNVPSTDIAYIQTKRDTANRLLNYVKFTHIIKTVQEATELSDAVLSAALSQIEQDRVYNEDKSKWLWKHNALRGRPSGVAGSKPNPTIVGTFAQRGLYQTNPGFSNNEIIPNQVSFFSGKNFNDDIGELNDTLLNLSSPSVLRDQFFQEDKSAWLWKHNAKHATNTGGKSGLDFVVEVNAQRDPASDNFVSFFSGKGFNDDIGEAQDNLVNISNSTALQDLVKSEAKPSKFFKNFHTTITKLSTGGTVEGREGHTADDTYGEDDDVLKPGLGKKEQVKVQDRVLNRAGRPLLPIRDRINFDQVKKHTLEINKTVPVFFATDFVYGASQRRAPGTPLIKFDSNINNPVVDPLYVRKYNEIYRYLRDPITGNLKYPNFASVGVPSFLIDGTNTFTTPYPQDGRIIFQPDSKHREDYVMIDDGHGSLSGDFHNVTGAEYKVLIPVWRGPNIGWSTLSHNYHPTKTAEGRRIMFHRDLTSVDASRAQVVVPVYNSDGVQIGTQLEQLNVQATGKSVFEKLRDLGRLGGLFFRRLGVEYLNSSAAVNSVASNVAGALPTVATDRVNAFFYPFQQNPPGQPEDVKLKKSLGVRKEFVQFGGIDLNGNSLERIGKFFKNYHNVRVLNEFQTKKVDGKVGGAESNNTTPISRFVAASKAPKDIYFDRTFVRSRRYPEAVGESDVILKSNIQPQGEEAHAKENNSNHFSNSVKNNLYYFGKIVEGITGLPNESIDATETFISAKNRIAESRAFIRQEFFAKRQSIEIRDEEPSPLSIITEFDSSGNPINLNTERPTTIRTVRRWKDRIYVSYANLQNRRTDQGTYTYTAFNTYTASNPLNDWQRSGYGPTIQLTSSKYDRTYNYRTGYAWNGFAISPTFDDTPYYAYIPSNNGSGWGFFWYPAKNHWVFIDGIGTSGGQLRTGSSGIVGIDEENFYIQFLTASDPKRPTGSHTLPDTANGGLVNFSFYFPPYTPSYAIQTVYKWQGLGKIVDIMGGDVQYPVGNTNVLNKQGKLLFGSDGHLYVLLYNVGGLGVFPTTGTVNDNQTGTPPPGGGSWRQVSYRTFANLQQPVPGEFLEPVGVQAKNTSTDKTFYKRVATYRRTHTETVEAADPGSAFIPVYCASYFLEPYVSEAGKSANF